jgi:isopentenyldiphosphate isomerase
MPSALTQIVNEQDEPIGQATKQEAWRKGLITRIVRVVAVNSDGQLLLQKRASRLALYPNCWSEAISGHVDAGETYLAAAQRELFEEIGITGVALQEIGYFRSSGNFEGRKLERFSKVYKIVLPEGHFKLRKSEVEEVQWFDIATIRAMMAQNPEDFVIDFRRVVDSIL